MISSKCLEKYAEQYPQDSIAYMEPSDLVFIVDIDGNEYIQPQDEDDATFLERLEISRKEKINMFYEIWKNLELDKNNIY